MLLGCDDGIRNTLPDPAILKIVTAHAGDLGEACRRLVARADAEGGRGNSSAVLLRYGD